MDYYLPFRKVESLLFHIAKALNTATPNQAPITITNVRIATISTIPLSANNLEHAKLLDNLNIAMQERTYWKEGGKYYDFELEEVEEAITAIATLYNIRHLM